MFLVTPHDSINQTFVLRRIDDSGKLVVNSEYNDLVCVRCRKVDERAALARRIAETIKVRSRRPFIASSDDFYLLDERAKQIFQSILPDLLDFIPIPNTKFFVTLTRNWFQPNENDPGFEFVDRRCPVCRRPRNVVWGKVPPKLGDVPRILAVNLESRLGCLPLWLVSTEVATELRQFSSKLTGMVISPKEVDDEQPVE
jgi:hypothetical protein